MRSRNEVSKHCEENQLHVEMDTIVFTHKTSGSQKQGVRSASVKTPRGAATKTTKTPKTPKTPKSPKAEPNRKRKLADKSEGKGKGRTDLQGRLKTGGRISKHNSNESAQKTQVKSSGKFKIKYNFGGRKRGSTGGNPSPAKRSRT